MKFLVLLSVFFLAINSSYQNNTADGDKYNMNGIYSDGGQEKRNNNDRNDKESWKSFEISLEEDSTQNNKEDENDNGDHLGHGDIMFRKGEEEAEFGRRTSNDEPSDEQASDAIKDLSRRWSMPVPYRFESLSSKAKTAILEAIAEISLKTCITFRKVKRGDTDYLSFFKDGKRCWSKVGKSGGKQRVSIGSRCEHKNVAIHEIMHALGFWHEQSRPDRDNYVTIHSKNIEEGEKHNFDKKSADDVTTFGFPYDYVSTMHYRKYDFSISKTKPTITAKNNSNQQLGRCPSCGMSIIDADQLNAMYCSAVQSHVNRLNLRYQVARLMAGHSGQSNEVFRTEVINFLRKVYPNYNFMVSAYNAVSGDETHSYIGKCSHVYQTYGKNVVVCYSRKTARIPHATIGKAIAAATLATIVNKNCNAKWARDTAWFKARSYGYPIAGIQIVRSGSALKTTWNGPVNFVNYKCHKCTGWWIHRRCNNDNGSTFVIMFG